MAQLNMVCGAAPSLSHGGIMKEDINANDWKKRPSKGFPYKDTDDPKYIKDRNKLFAESGNGWWWYQGTSLGKYIGKDEDGN